MNFSSDEGEEDLEDEEDLEEEEDDEDEDSEEGEDYEGEDGEDGVGEEDLARFMMQLERQGASGMGAPQGMCPCCGVPGQQMQLRKFAADEDDSDEDSDGEIGQNGNSDYGV